MIITVGKSGLTDVLDTLHNIWSTVSHFCAMVNSIHKIKLFDRKNFSLKLQANFFLRKYIYNLITGLGLVWGNVDKFVNVLMGKSFIKLTFYHLLRLI